MDTLFGIIIFIGFWLLINRVVVYFSGWGEFSKNYRAHDIPQGKRFSFRSGFGNWWCLNYIVSDKGLYVSAIPPFNIGSPPLLFPWSDIKINFGDSSFVDKGEVIIKKIKLKIPSDVLKECSNHSYLNNCSSSDLI